MVKRKWLMLGLLIVVMAVAVPMTLFADSPETEIEVEGENWGPFDEEIDADVEALAADLGGENAVLTTADSEVEYRKLDGSEVERLITCYEQVELFVPFDRSPGRITFFSGGDASEGCTGTPEFTIDITTSPVQVVTIAGGGMGDEVTFSIATGELEVDIEVE